MLASAEAEKRTRKTAVGGRSVVAVGKPPIWASFRI